MKIFNWNTQKNEILKRERNLCFEDVLLAIHEDRILTILQHPNNQKYKDQKIFVIEIANYAYLVPFVENEKEVFLKTIIPSRKATKDYLIN